MSKRAFLVTGPESSGNRMMAAILSAAGCRGSGSTDSPYNDQLPAGESPVVIIRSFPHGGRWPNLRELIAQLQSCGYEVTVLVTARGPVALERSQVAAGHQVDGDGARQAIAEAYGRIFPALFASGTRWMLVPYEALVLNPDTAVPELLELLGLNPDFGGHVRVDHQLGPITDQNRKHYRVRIA